MKLTFVKRDTTDREGNELKTKDGRPYTRMSIKVEEKGDKYISGFGSKENESWKVGDDVEITVTESDKTDKNGEPYLNFSIPKKEDRVLDNTERILNALVGINLKLAVIVGKLEGKTHVSNDVDYSDYPEANGEVAF